MRDLFHGLRDRGKGWFFDKSSLTEDTSAFSNPVRGWYQIHSFPVEQEPDFDELEWCVDREDNLAMVILDIGFYREQDLDAEGLERIRRIFDFFVKHGYDLIVRAVYDREGRAMEKEPYFFRQVLKHLEQLGDILREFSGHIFVYQGMLVGSWGEMHSSRFLSSDKIIQMADILRCCSGEEIYLAVRRPVYWREIHKEAEAADGMGLFDDGLFGSESDLGTFGTEPKSRAAWNSAWCRADELAFVNALCDSVPNGGEAVFDSEFQKELNPERIVEELKKMQITYLNKVYDGRQLDSWKKWTYPQAGIWSGRSLYDYIGAHLGYRFLIKSVTVTNADITFEKGNPFGKERLFRKKNPKQCLLKVEVENTGFAAFYQNAEIYLECVESSGRVCRTAFLCQMKGWRSGEKRTLSCGVEICDCEMFLTAERAKDGACIRFANTSDKAGRVRIGALREGKP